MIMICGNTVKTGEASLLILMPSPLLIYLHDMVTWGCWFWGRIFVAIKDVDVDQRGTTRLYLIFCTNTKFKLYPAFLRTWNCTKGETRNSVLYFFWFLRVLQLLTPFL